CGQVVDAVNQHRQFLTTTDIPARRALMVAERELTTAIQELVLERLRGPRWDTIVGEVAARRRDPYAAASELLDGWPT
ncbi:MAG: methylmalonyl Co-A mutase-associated GTPase MeaB, partial [Chloroflexi bacterium]